MPPEVLARVARDAALAPGPPAARDLTAEIARRIGRDPAWRLIVAEDRRGRLGGYVIWRHAGRVVHIEQIGHWSADPTGLLRLSASGLPWGHALGAERATGLVRHRPRAWAKLVGWTHTADLWLLEAS